MNQCNQEMDGDNYGSYAILFPPRINYTHQNETWLLPKEMSFNEGHVISILAYSTLVLFSAVANISVLSHILRKPMPHSRLNKMLIHLAIADLLVTLIHMPSEIFWSMTVSWWAGDLMCRLTAFFRTFGIYQSSYVLICISIDRYLAVLKPLLFQNLDSRGQAMITCAWFTSFVCSLPQAVIFHEECHPKVSWYKQCIALNAFPTENEEFAYFLFGMMMMYIIPLFVIIFCYVSILVKICKKFHQTNNGGLRRSSFSYLNRAKVRTLKMTLTIVVVFCVCWTPYHIMALWYQMDKRSARKVDLRVQKFLFLFACTNSCMNPVVYGLYNLRSTVAKQNSNNYGMRNINYLKSSLQKTSFTSSRNTVFSTAL